MIYYIEINHKGEYCVGTRLTDAHPCKNLKEAIEILRQIINFVETEKLKDTNESINFERGQEPFKAMKIGKEARPMKEYDIWVDSHPNSDRKIINLLNTIGEARFAGGVGFSGARIVIVKTKETKKTIRLLLKYYIDKKIVNKNIIENDLDESLNFERGQDPFRAMNVGKDRTRRSYEEAYVSVMDMVRTYDIDDISDEGFIEYVSDELNVSSMLVRLAMRQWKNEKKYR
jgi:hypothetical protein